MMAAAVAEGSAVRGGGTAVAKAEAGAGKKELLLIVDDDALILDALSAFFEEYFTVVGALQLREMKSALAQLDAPLDYALVDLGLPPQPHLPTEGFAALSILQAQAPECAVVVVSGQDARRHGQQARALGAADYAEKPCDPQTLLDKLRLARRLKVSGQAAHGLVGESAPLAALREQIALIAPVSFPVLIEGESGAGKELVARALHNSARAGKPFLAVNCAAIPEHLVEPTLFGHVRGAYTGAVRDGAGYLGDAGGGTLLLDEVGDLPEAAQAKLMRVLETGEYRQVGDTRPRQCSARIVAASNRRLRGGGRMRDDLYYRLSVFSIAVPPLRRLGEDRFLLLAHFRAAVANDLSGPPFSLAAAAEAVWRDYGFPGNVRELKNIVARLQVKYGGGEVGAAALRAELCEETAEGGGDEMAEVAARDAAPRLAAWAARRALAECGGDGAAAARLLRVSEPVLQNYLSFV